jgi:adhesin transport system membrane fusion protein
MIAGRHPKTQLKGRLDLQEHPLSSLSDEIDVSWATRSLVWFALGLIGVTMFWASQGRLDIVSHAPGEVVPASSVKQVQHLEGGIIELLLVEEGQAVLAGDPILELEPTRSRADTEVIKQQIASLSIDKLRLIAEIENADSIPLDDLEFGASAELVQSAKSLFLARKEGLQTEIQLLTSRQRQLEATRDEVRARIESNERILIQTSEQIKISKKLLQQELTNRMSHIELLREEEQIKGSVATDRAMLARVGHMLIEAEVSIRKAHSDFETAAREQLDRTNRELDKLAEQNLRFEDSLNRTVVRAPQNGIVKTLFFKTEGGIVPPGGVIAEIVPSDDRLVIEARIPLQDIGFVYTGINTTIRLTTADASRFGELRGRVAKISPDAIISNDGSAFYKATIETETPSFEHNENRYDLYPGMRVQSSILIGERTVLEYILSPFEVSSSGALTER